MANDLLGDRPSEERSAIMRAVPHKGSKPEIVVRRMLHQLGYVPGAGAPLALVRDYHFAGHLAIGHSAH